MKLKECAIIEAFKCSEEEPIIEVAKKLRKITLRHIFVVNKKDYPVGIISVMDINNRVVAEGKDIKKLKAKDIMSVPDVFDVEDDVKDVFKIMTEKQRALNPVVKNKKMIGIISVLELVNKVK
mgnify:FL=1